MHTTPHISQTLSLSITPPQPPGRYYWKPSPTSMPLSLEITTTNLLIGFKSKEKFLCEVIVGLIGFSVESIKCSNYWVQSHR